MKLFQILLLTGVVALFLLAPLANIGLAADSAPIFGKATEKLQTTSEAAELGDPSDTDPAQVVSNAVNTVIGLLGIVAVILVIYAGGLWLTAAGSEEKVTKAKKILRSTVVGIVIVGLAYGITTFVINLVVSGP